MACKPHSRFPICKYLVVGEVATPNYLKCYGARCTLFVKTCRDRGARLFVYYTSGAFIVLFFTANDKRRIWISPVLPHYRGSYPSDKRQILIKVNSIKHILILIPHCVIPDHAGLKNICNYSLLQLRDQINWFYWILERQNMLQK